MVKIYGIKHRTTGYVYVGCTAANLNKRMREHRCILKAGKHSSSLLQAHWDADGEEAFEMIVLEQLPDDCTVVAKRVAEIYWMQKHQDNLYNAHQNSFAPTSEAIRKGVEAGANKRRGVPQSAELIRKRTACQRGVPKNHGAKISATKRAKAMR